MNDQRRRGVRVSRVRLQQALAASGLKTQTAVAERIADEEQLDTVPRGLVNKVFRGERVDPRSIERVARALQVEAWTLYPSSDEPVAAADTAIRDEATPVSEPRTAWSWRYATGAVLVLLTITLLALIQPWTDSPREPASATVVPAEAPQSTTVIILPFPAPHDAVLAAELRTALGQDWRLLPYAGDPSGDAQELLRQGLAERVIESRADIGGRWQGITLYLHQPGSMTSIWQGALPDRAAAPRIRRLMQQAAAAIIKGEALGAETQEAQTRYLIGRRHLDQPATELNVRRALTAFESALRADPRHVGALSGLCEALVVENVRTGDAARLVEAAQQCTAALELAPDDPEALRVQAYLDRKRGRLDESLTAFQQVLAASPDNIDALLGITETHLTRFRRGEADDALQQALAAIGRADALHDHFWKIPYIEARVHYFSGQIDLAVAAIERAVAIEANLFTLNNLGVFEFCRGNFAAAREAYNGAKAADPGAFAGEAQLAVVHYFLGDFERAVVSFKQSLDLHAASGAAEDHRLWGNYADGLRHAGHHQQAIEAYVRAIALAEQAVAKGDGNPFHETGLAYYYEMLYLLDPTRAANRATLEQLSALSNSNDPLALLYLAIIYQVRGHSDEADGLRQRGTQGCPGFAGSPDFKLQGN
ncbi:MAG: hypothetical protein Tsb002_04740 [Wenzhouxiangellaceae bacterium]